MDKDTVITKKSGIMTADTSGNTVMLDIESGKYYDLGDTGGRIWELLSSPMTVHDLINTLTTEYGISSERCEKDTMPFLESLKKRGLIIEK